MLWDEKFAFVPYDGPQLTPSQSQVLNPSQKMKSDIVSFKQNIVTEILNVAPQLPANSALQLLSRAEAFVRAQLPDKSAQRKLSALLLLKVKLPDVNRNDMNQEIVFLLVQVQDDSQLRKFLCETEESEVVSLLPNLHEETVASLHKAMQDSFDSCKGVIDKEFVARLASHLGDADLKTMWKVLLSNCNDASCEWSKAVALILAAFIERLTFVALEDLQQDLLNLTRKYLENQDEAKTFAIDFFQSDCGISTGLWPRKGAAKIFAELAFRLKEDNEERLQLLIKAHSIDGEDTEIRKHLKGQHMLQEVDSLAGVDVEGLFLKLMLEDKEEIPAIVLQKLSLQENRIKDLSAEHLMSLAQQLSQAGRRVDAAQVAVDAAKLFAQNANGRADESPESQDAFLKAFGWNRNNEEASDGLVTVVLALKESNQKFKLQGEEFEALKKMCEDLQEKCKDIDMLRQKCDSLERKFLDPYPLGTSFVWDLSSYNFTNMRKGHKQKSDNFQISPGISARLQVYPKGRSGSLPDMAAVHLRLDRPARVRFTLQWGQALRTAFHEDYVEDAANRSYGWNSVVATSAANNNITLKLLSVQPGNSSVRMIAPLEWWSCHFGHRCVRCNELVLQIHWWLESLWQWKRSANARKGSKGAEKLALTIICSSDWQVVLHNSLRVP